jgi:hypothetical protein
MLKEDFSPEISFAEHLRQFRRLRNHVAEYQGISLKEARFLYNYLLSENPTLLATFFR